MTRGKARPSKMSVWNIGARTVAYLFCSKKLLWDVKSVPPFSLCGDWHRQNAHTVLMLLVQQTDTSRQTVPTHNDVLALHIYTNSIADTPHFQAGVTSIYWKSSERRWSVEMLGNKILKNTKCVRTSSVKANGQISHDARSPGVGMPRSIPR